MSERERAKALESVTTSLQGRVHSMASTSEAGNKQLTGQIAKLRQQLDQSKRTQMAAQHQVGGERGTTCAWSGHLGRPPCVHSSPV
jgi:hypothetical protein